MHLALPSVSERISHIRETQRGTEEPELHIQRAINAVKQNLLIVILRNSFCLFCVAGTYVRNLPG